MNLLYQLTMEKTYNFFKNKPIPMSKTNSNQKYNLYTNKRPNKPSKSPNPTNNHNPISNKEKEIRQAIEYRFQRSKLRGYRFENLHQRKKSIKSIDSSQMQEYKKMNNLRMVDLKQYHKKEESLMSSKSSSKDKSKITLKLRLKDHKSGTIKTEGHYSSQKSPYINQILKSMTPTKSNSTDKWKFISIQIKQDLSKSKHPKLDLKISSHRSYILPIDQKTRIKSSTSTGKYIDKVPKLKNLSKLNKAKF